MKLFSVSFSTHLTQNTALLFPRLLTSKVVRYLVKSQNSCVLSQTLVYSFRRVYQQGKTK